MILLLDAANTIIHKPLLSVRFLEVLSANGFSVNPQTFKYHHKLLSESIIFPDKTSKDFYAQFNSELLYTLGIIPTSGLLDQIFSACSYLPWESFPDVDALSRWDGKIGVLSNFHKGLTDLLATLIPGKLEQLIISEESHYRKPDVRFFSQAIDQFKVAPSEIVYIGDSPKLDLEPALKVGMNAWLIDRDNFYPSCQKRLLSLHDVFDALA